MILHMSISSSGCWIYMWVSSRIIKKRGMQEKKGREKYWSLALIRQIKYIRNHYYLH